MIIKKMTLLTSLIVIFLINVNCQSNGLKKEIANQLVLNQKIIIDGLQREFHILQPHNLNSTKKYPLVISLHGHSGNKEYNSGISEKKSPHSVFNELAIKEKFFVVYPQGEKGSDNKRGWNGCRSDAETNPTTNDTQFISNLIEYMKQNYPVDSSRVYVVGTSNGGEMTARLAVEIPEKLAAVAVVAFSWPAKSECKEPTTPISILFMNGTEDPLAPYNGGVVGKDRHKRGTVLSVQNSIDFWVSLNKTSKTPEVKKLPNINIDDNSEVEEISFTGGIDNTEVIHYKINGGGHVEPSIKEQLSWLYLKIVGKQNKDIEFAEVIWNFFKNKKR